VQQLDHRLDLRRRGHARLRGWRCRSCTACSVGCSSSLYCGGGAPRTRTSRSSCCALGHLLPRRRWMAFRVAPTTLLRWHRQLVRRRWTYSRLGRPPVDPDVVDLVVRLARENPRLGLSAHQRRVGQAGGESVGHVGPHHLAAPGPRTRAETTWGTELVDVPARARGGHRGLRPSHRGDDRAASGCTSCSSSSSSPVGCGSEE